MGFYPSVDEAEGVDEETSRNKRCGYYPNIPFRIHEIKEVQQKGTEINVHRDGEEGRAYQIHFHTVAPVAFIVLKILNIVGINYECQGDV